MKKLSEFSAFLKELEFEGPDYCYTIGYNSAIEQLGKLKVGLNEEKVEHFIREYNMERLNIRGLIFALSTAQDIIELKENND